MKILLACLTVGVALFLATPVHAVTNLLTNSGFLDTDSNTEYGDNWGSYGSTGFHAFFGAANPHASLFGDNATNIGGFFQQGITGTAGTKFQFDLIGTRIESNWDADLQFGIEFYAADDTTKLGETKVPIDTATRLANGQVDGNIFSMQATAPAGTAFVRPIAEFDDVNFGYVNEPQANTFVFNSFLSEVLAPGGELLKNPGFEDEDAQGDLGDFWSSFGAAGFNAFFGANGHASLFADNPANFGGVYQQSILGAAGSTYEFSLLDVRIEENFNADLRFGLEYYGDADFTKLGETIESIDFDTGQVDGNAFVMSGTAPVGTVYVRPVVLFDDVVSTAATQENIFIFDASLIELVTTDLAGDYNGDGVVDAADYVIWRKNENATGAPGITGDGDNGTGTGTPDGVVNQHDYNYWRANFGDSAAGSGAASGQAAVPEPATLTMALGWAGLMHVAFGIARSRRRPRAGAHIARRG